MENSKFTTYLSLREVAEYLNVSLSYARRVVKEQIPYYTFGCRIYTDKNDLDKWIAAHKHTPKAKFSIEDLVGPIEPF